MRVTDQQPKGELLFTTLSVTRERLFDMKGNLQCERFSVLDGDDLICEDARYDEAEQAIAGCLTKDVAVPTDHLGEHATA